MEFFNGISRPTLSDSYWHGPLGVTSMSTVEVVITTNQSTVVLYPSLVEWFLHTKAVGGLCMPTNECSKGKNCCSPKHYHTHPTHIFRQVNFACHCTPLFTKFLFYKSHRCLGTCMKTGSLTSPPRGYPSSTYYTTVLYFVTVHVSKVCLDSTHAYNSQRPMLIGYH